MHKSPIISAVLFLTLESCASTGTVRPIVSDVNDVARVLCAIEEAQKDTGTKTREAFRKACAEHETFDPYLQAILEVVERSETSAGATAEELAQ